jgi:hypothetical protein
MLCLQKELKECLYENTTFLFYLMISGVVNGDPLEILEFRQHDWGSHH